MEPYSSPEMEVSFFEAEDVIMTSGDADTPAPVYK